MSLEWFRWYHGTFSDPKLALVAKKAKQPRAVAVAVWAALLECASQANPRGSILNFDEESVAVALDFDENVVPDVLAAMRDKGMIMDDKLSAWEKRQVRRERDDNSRDRVAEYRKRQKSVTPSNAENSEVTPDSDLVTPCNDNSDEVTPSNAENVTQIREDKRRKEKKEKTQNPSRKREDDLFESSFWICYPKKVGKQDARKAWEKLNPDPDLLAVMIKAIANQSKDKETKQALGVFFNPWPDPVRWLNGRRWEDETCTSLTTQSNLGVHNGYQSKPRPESTSDILARTDAALKARFQRENEASQTIRAERDISDVGHRVAG